MRGESGELLAAIAGHTWGRTCEVKQLWVTDRLRRSGLGGRLLAAAEREARERRCDQIALATHSFQAPDFYRAHGYREAGRIRDYPAGHDQIWFVKPL